MSNENKSNAQSKPLHLQFTRAQSQALSKILPQNYTLELLSKLKKESSRNPTKKIFTNEGNAIKKNGTTHVEPPAPPLVSTPSESAVTQPTKRVLRDKKPANTYIEDKFIEVLPMPPAVNPKSGKLTPENTKKCADILRRLKKHKCAGPFLHPVDVEGLGLYDYYDVVSEPMDLSTVEKKLKGGEYLTVQDFGTDIRKIWDNALAYNTEGSSIYQMTLNMKTYFTKIFAEISDFQFNDKVKDLEEQVRYLTKAVTELTRPGPQTLAPPKPSKGGSKAARSPAVLHNDEEMSVKEKKILCEHIKKLQPEALQGVWEIVSKGLPEKQLDNEELVFDIDILPVKVARELERYVKSKIAHGGHNRSHPNGAKSKGNQHQHTHTQAPPPLISNPPVELAKRPKNDAESKSSDSSFITDSESGSDTERRHKAKPAANYHVKQQDLVNFQAGSHGSMMNSFIVK